LHQSLVDITPNGFDFAALQPMDAPKAEKPKSDVKLKTMETAPPSVDITANVPSMA